jgi:hypothetical protein
MIFSSLLISILMQLSNIAHLEFLLKLWFKLLQLDYITCQYDQIVHVEDCHEQIFVRSFDVQQTIHLAPTKAPVDIE